MSNFLIEKTVLQLNKMYGNLSEAIISTRVPKDNNHSRADNQVSHSLVKTEHPERFQQNIDVMRDQNLYPDFHGGVQNMSHEDASEHMIEHMKKNLLHLHDTTHPQDVHQSKQWYDGANRIAKRMVKRYGLRHHETTSSVIAALSPQKNWDENVSLAHRVLHIVSNKGDHPWSNKMEEKSKAIAEKSTEISKVMKHIRGKTLNQLVHPAHKAAWIRIHDEAHHPRQHPKMLPDGTHSGEYGNTTSWGSLNEITKAVAIIDSDKRTGNQPKSKHIENISRIMGDNHKTRGFGNNIADPNSRKGDVTIDTHAVAAAHMMPLGSESNPVSHAFGKSPKKKSPHWRSVSNAGKASSGTIGTNYMYTEAYRRAAKERGILPREMQSIAWEAVRKKFPDKAKASLRAPIENVWKRHQSGEIDHDQALNEINNIASEKRSRLKPAKPSATMDDDTKDFVHKLHQI